MPSRESRVFKRGKETKSGRRAANPVRQKGSMFTAALGLNASGGSVPSLPASGSSSIPSLRRTPRPAPPASSFWQPIRSFALSQLTSLVRRATLKESDLTPKYEKVHNFKVSVCVHVRACLEGVREKC